MKMISVQDFWFVIKCELLWIQVNNHVSIFIHANKDVQGYNNATHCHWWRIVDGVRNKN